MSVSGEPGGWDMVQKTASATAAAHRILGRSFGEPCVGCLGAGAWREMMGPDQGRDSGVGVKGVCLVQ